MVFSTKDIERSHCWNTDFSPLPSVLLRALCVSVVKKFVVLRLLWKRHLMTTFAPPESVADLLCQLIRVPSVNPMGREVSGPIYFEGRLSDWLVQFFQSFEAPHERIEVVPGRDNVIARYDSPGAELTLLLDAHQDTVPVDGMTISPFEPQVENGRITGRGASDVKGGLAAMLFAFRR